MTTRCVIRQGEGILTLYDIQGVVARANREIRTRRRYHRRIVAVAGAVVLVVLAILYRAGWW